MRDTEQLAGFISEVSYDDLRPDVIHKVKSILLDSIGCALGGHALDKTKIALEFVRDLGGNPQATIIGCGRTSASNAAFANGELINALDWDCIGPLTPHVIPYVLPPCLATAEMNHSSGKELILAVAIAAEIGGRMNASVLQHRMPTEEPPFHKPSPRYSYTPSVFGGTAGACKILDMDVAKVANALGIAGVSAPVAGMMKWQYISGPSPMLKYNSWTGWIAQLGLVSTLMAEKGFTSDTTVLDGDLGFWQMYGSPFFRRDAIFENLGRTWWITETEFKPYPHCRGNHGAIDGIIKLIRENNIKPDNIAEIRVWADSWFINPAHSQEVIEHSVDTQFSAAYSCAVAAVHGEDPGPHWCMPVVYSDPRVIDIMKRVRVEKHPQTDAVVSTNLKEGKMPVVWLGRVEITANGREYSTEVAEAWGKGSNVFSDSDIERKFYKNASFSRLTLSQAERTVGLVKDLETIADVSELAAAYRVE